jgi:hypothetical protein
VRPLGPRVPAIRPANADEVIGEAARFIIQACPPSGGGAKTFCGVMYGRVTDLRKAYKDILTMAVYFTPLERDPAQADKK